MSGQTIRFRVTADDKGDHAFPLLHALQAEERMMNELEVIEQQGLTPLVLTAIELVEAMASSGYLCWIGGAAQNSVFLHNCLRTPFPPVQWGLRFDLFAPSQAGSQAKIIVYLQRDCLPDAVTFLSERFGLQPDSSTQPSSDNFKGGWLELAGRDELLLLASVSSQDKSHSYRRTYHPDDSLDPSLQELFARAATRGVRGFESTGMRRILQRVQPTTIEELAVLFALYRPKQIERIDPAIRRLRNGISPTVLGYCLYVEELIHWAEENLEWSSQEALDFLGGQRRVRQRFRGHLVFAQSGSNEVQLASEIHASLVPWRVYFLACAEEHGMATWDILDAWDELLLAVQRVVPKAAALDHAWTAIELARAKLDNPGLFRHALRMLEQAR